MNVGKMSKKGVRILLAILMCVLVLFPCAPTYASSSNKDDEVETVGDIYDVSTALTAYVNAVVGGNGSDEHNYTTSGNRVENPGNSGNAGAYVGYGDEDNNFKASITSNTTYGASASTYDAWEEIFMGSPNAAYGYVRYGKTLTDAGLDSQGVSGGVVRKVGGFLSGLAYAGSEAVPIMFNFSLKILRWMNPFQYLINAVDARGNSYGITGQRSAIYDADTQAQRDSNPVYSLMHGADSISSYVSNMYKQMSKIGWTVTVPLMLAVLALQVLLLRSQRPGATIMNVVKRIVFIAIGVPLLAGLYTSTLNALDEVTSNKTAATRLVAASFCDFGTWVDEKQLFPITAIESSPKGTDGATNDGGVASAQMLRKLRRITLTLNRYNHVIGDVGDLTGDDVHDMLSGNIWNRDGSDGGGYGGSNQESLAQTGLLAQQQNVMGLVTKYANGGTYSASSWGSNLRKKLKNTAGEANMGFNGEDKPDDSVNKMFDDTDEMGDWMKRTVADNQAIWNRQGFADGGAWAGSNFNIFADGKLQANGSPTTTMTWSGGGLSSISMYNYLSTSFNDSSLVVYSNAKSVSEYTKEEHYLVNLIGTGALRALFWANMMACIGVLAVIALSYSFHMAIDNIRTGIKMLIQVPVSMLGVVKSIAQVITYVVLMIAEAVASIFMYTLIAELFIVFATMIEHIATDNQVTNFSTVLGGRFATLGLNVNPMLVCDSRYGICFMIAIETACVLFCGVMFMKYRYAFAYVHAKVWNWAFDMVTFDEVKAYRESLDTNVQWQPSGVAVLFQNMYAILRNGHEEKREVAMV